jgi:LDH2 family malate/lactate/ureidoglycolate dehydrogenase
MIGFAEVSSEALEGWTAQVLVSQEVSRNHADLAAAILVEADRRGQLTHGIARLASYVDRLRAGELNSRPQVHVEVRGGALVIDGDNGLGQVVATEAMDLALGRLCGQATQVFFLKRAGHLGALGSYVRRAAEQGKAALIAQVSQPIMAPEGARAAAIGNNPLAFAAPLSDGPPLVFDMSCSKVARGNVLLAAWEKQPIPNDWAIGRDGRPTTDAAEALLGAMLPMGGHKGLGLAMLVQVLAGSLTGAAPRALAGQGAAPAVGAFGLVVDPDQIVGRAAFDAHMRSWIGNYLEAVGEHGRLPGRGETLARLSLPLAIRDELVALGDRVGVPFDFWRADR